MMLSFHMLVLTIWATLFSITQAIPTISVAGSKFFTSDGNQFFIKGIAYQLVDDDPLANPIQCQLDAALMATTGANAIRVYHVDPNADHSGCMNAFAAKGIYVFLDADSFKTYIRYGPLSSYTQTKANFFRAVVDNFAGYDNTAGFFVGNEVLNGVVDSGAAPFLLTAAVDLKTHMKAKGYRQIPVGYSATDTDALRPMLADYLVCRPNVTERVDFYSLNSYEWCGSTPTYQTSGYVNLQAALDGYPAPIFFSEDGCNTVPPRTFSDQAAIFGPEMSDTWSGAMIYEWIEEMNAYGLVSYGPKQADSVNVGSSIVQGFVRQGTPTPVQPDFGNLQSAWATITPTGVASAAYMATYTSTPRSCPAYTAGGWTVDPNAALPTIGDSSDQSVTSSTSTGSGTSSMSTSTRTGSATSSATSQGAAGKSPSNPLSFSDVSMMGMIAALITVGAGMVLLL